MSNPENTETENTETANSVAKATSQKLPTVGSKGKFTYFAANNLVIVGLDTEAPGAEAHRLLHILHQPQRLVGIQQQGTGDLESTIVESGGTINNPVEYIDFKIGTQVEHLVVTGRRRVLAGRALGIPVPAIKLDPNDSNLWKHIRSENAARSAPSALEIAADVEIMLAGDSTLGIEPMDFESVGRVYGMSHLWARGMAKLAVASPAVKKAMNDGVLSATHAYEIAMEKTHEEQDALLALAIENGMSVASLKARRAAKKAAAAASTDGGTDGGTGTDGEVKVATVHSTTWMRDMLRGLDDSLSAIHEAEAALDDNPDADVVCNVLGQPDDAVDDLDTQRSKILAIYNTVRAFLGEGEFGSVEGDDRNLDPGGESEALWLAAVNASGRGEAARKQDAAEAKAKADAEAVAKKAKAAAERAEKKAKADDAKKAKAAEADKKKQEALAAARAKDAAKDAGKSTAAGTPGPGAV